MAESLLDEKERIVQPNRFTHQVRAIVQLASKTGKRWETETEDVTGSKFVYESGCESA